MALLLWNSEMSFACVPEEKLPVHRKEHDLVNQDSISYFCFRLKKDLLLDDGWYFALVAWHHHCGFKLVLSDLRDSVWNASDSQVVIVQSVV